MRWLPVLLTLAACADEPRGPAAPPQGAHGAAPANQGPLRTLEHDFGVIPHGETRQHEFPLDLSRLGEGYVPLRVHLDCSCGHADIRLRRADGTERFADPGSAARNVLAPGEAAWVRVVIDTATKEPLDQKVVPSKGFVVAQHADDLLGSTRVQWPLLVHFGVDAPVDLRPSAAFDFQRIAESRRGALTTTLRGDERHRDATFGPATAADPALSVELVKEEDHWLLRVGCRPGAVGHYRSSITIATSIPGYRLELPVTWKVVPDLDARPMTKLSFRVPRDRAQTEAESKSQFVLVVDHDERRPAEFAVHRIVDAAGRDLSASFVVTFEPLEGSREQRMRVRYTGGLTENVRGSIVLTKDGERGPFLPIELVVFLQ